ncbi:MAG: GDP-mannose 4,6-dehydratase [Patescibacteria group bacterium]
MSKNESKKTILITGGAGFIGSNVLIYLFDKYKDYKFIVLDVLTYAADVNNIPERIKKSTHFKFWYGDVRNAKLVEHLVGQANIVIHFAAETHVTRSIYDDAIFFETDVLGTQRVSNAVLHNRDKIERFIHISTSEVYGTAVAPKMSENHPLNPMSPYAAAKAGADRLVYSYVVTYKIPAIIIRPFNMYGPQQHLEKLIPRFITSCILGEPLSIHGTGESKRDFTYVIDLARAIDLVIHAPIKKVAGEVFNVGSATDISVNEIADAILKLTKGVDRGSQKKHNPYALNVGDRPGQVFRHTADTSKIRKVLGWKPTVDFKHGIKETIDWYVKNKDWWEDKVWMRCVPIETESGKTEMH